MKFCSLDEAFNNTGTSYTNCDIDFNYDPLNQTQDVQNFSTTYGYNNQDLAYKTQYTNPYDSYKGKDNNLYKENDISALSGICENFRAHYYNCPECAALFDKQQTSASKTIEHFTNGSQKYNNIIIFLLILLLIWIMSNKK